MSRERGIMVRKGFVGFVLRLIATIAACQPALGHELDQFVLERMREWAVPGMAVAVVKDGEVAFVQGYGVLQAGRPETVDGDTIFGVGSISKTFTSTAAAMLVDEGRMSWDAPVRTYLPAFALNDPWTSRQATLRDLSAHRLGVDSDLPWMPRSWRGARTLASFAHLQPRRRFGDFEYSNIGTLALGLAIEAVSGGSWDAFIAERIFKPLRMSRSNTSEYTFVRRENVATCWLCAAPAGAVVGLDALASGETNAAAPHGLDLDGPLEPGAARRVDVWPWRYEGSIAPAGAVNSTPRDLARWMLLHLDGAAAGAPGLVSETQMREIHAFQALRRASTAVAPADRSDYDNRYSLTGYGLGWAKYIYRGREVSAHGGGQVGFGATMWLVPAERLGVVVLQNLDYRHSSAYSAVVLRFIDHYLGLQPLNAAEPLMRKWSAAHEGREAIAEEISVARRFTREELQAFVGTYSHPAVGEVEVLLKDGALMLSFEPTSVAELHSVGGVNFQAEFQSAGRWILPVTFASDPQGRVQELTLAQWGRPADRYTLRRISGQVH